MPFCEKIKLHFKKYSRKEHSPLCFYINKKINNENSKDKAKSKRGSVSASFIKTKGSLTVEAALVLPLFLFAMIALIYMTEAIRFSGNLQAALSETAREASVYSYPFKELTGRSSIGGAAGSKIMGAAGAKAVVLERLGGDYINSSPVRKGSGGISFIHSDVLKNEMIDLAAVWETDIPFIPDELKSIKIIDRARVRAFTGYDNTHASSSADDEEDEEIVYVTDYGTVYHRNRNCRHLKLSIENVKKSDIGSKRNEYGAKYYKCEYCGSREAGTYFITSDGDRYHSSATCPGLKRTIHEQLLSETDLPACSDCGR